MFILQEKPSLSFNPPSSFSYSISDRFLFYFHVNQGTNNKHIHHIPNSDSYETIRFCHLVLFHLHYCFHLTRSKMTLLCLLYSNFILLIKMYIACIYSLTAISKEETELAAGPCFNSRISLALRILENSTFYFSLFATEPVSLRIPSWP